jgi:hypothetical protein
MLRLMEAEILVRDWNTVNAAIAALIEQDFAVRIRLDRIDDYGPAVWLNAQVASALDDDRFFDWVQSIVAPLRGDVLETGFWAPPPTA